MLAHAQKPDFVFRRNGRVHLNRRGRQFSRLLAAEVCASAVVMLDTPCSEVMWRVLATHSIRQFPLHFPSRASPGLLQFNLKLAGAWFQNGIVTVLRGHSWFFQSPQANGRIPSHFDVITSFSAVHFQLDYCAPWDAQPLLADRNVSPCYSVTVTVLQRYSVTTLQCHSFSVFSS